MVCRDLRTWTIICVAPTHCGERIHRANGAGALGVVGSLVFALLIGSDCSAGDTISPRDDTSDGHRCVGFNYFHETWTDTYCDRPKFLKTEAQMKADFDRMKRVGATAVRIHGANTEEVENAVKSAKHEHIKLQVWLSYRPNMRDLNVAQVEAAKEHPVYPRDLPARYFINPGDKNNKKLNAAGLEKVKQFREEYVKHFSGFLSNIASQLTPGDVLIVANEITIDLGYEFDNTSPVPKGTFLQHLFAMARQALPNIELTFATMPSELERSDVSTTLRGVLGDDGRDWLVPPGDWDALYQAGMDFVSLNSYWSSTNLRTALSTLQNKSKSPTVAVTEFGAVAHRNAYNIGGDGGKVASKEEREYSDGKQTQREGVKRQLDQVEGLPLRGLFVFAWDEPSDNVFGVVQTNMTPLLSDDLRHEYGHEGSWSTGCEFKMVEYLPVGKDACDELARRWNSNSKERPLGVELVMPPQKISHIELVSAPKTTKIRTTLKCSLKTTPEKYDQGVCKYIGLGEDKTTFWLLDDPEGASLVFNWQDDKQTEISVDAKSASSLTDEPISWRKDYNDRNHVITISFQAGQLPSDEGMLDVVVLIDKSGSMSDDVEVVKQQVDTLLNRLAALAEQENISLQVGLVTFMYTGTDNVFEVSPLTEDTGPIRQFITQLSSQDVHGDEDLYAAMMYAMNEPVNGKKIEMGWRHLAAKIAIPVTDEMPKEDTFTLAEVAQTALNLDPVHVYPLVMPKSPLSWLDPAVSSLKELASATGGEAVQVESAEKLPDAIIAAVKLAIRRHKEEIWRKENPPYVLYSVGAGIGAIIALALVVLLVRGIGRVPAAEVASVSADARLTGQTEVTPETRREE